MDNRGQSTAHHWGWMITLLIFTVLVIWGISYIQASNRPNTLEKGATQIEDKDTYWPLSISIGKGGCASLGVEKAREDKQNAATINNKASH